MRSAYLIIVFYVLEADKRFSRVSTAWIKAPEINKVFVSWFGLVFFFNWVVCGLNFQWP